MKKRSYSFSESLGHTFSMHVITCLILGGFTLVTVGLYHLADVTKLQAFRVVGVAVLLIGIFIAFFASKEVYRRMAEDDSLSFSLAIAHTWYHYLLCISFMPLIGPAIERFVEWRKRKNPFLADETKEPKPPEPTASGRGSS